MELFHLLREKHKIRARESLLDFTTYTKPDYEVNWHHREIARTLQAFIDGKTKWLSISIPPQFGKSELSTRRLAAFLLGINPDLSIAVCGYASDIAADFNRDIQRIIDSPEYQDIFPNTRLNGKRVATDSGSAYLRNSKEFQIVGHRGRLISVGIGGPLTGKKVDIALIDDPYKGPDDAYSEIFRRRVVSWWNTVLKSRLHNNAKICITMTRWHHDDIVGTLLQKQPDKWTVLKLKAIKEGPDLDYQGKELFRRNEGESLWEERHSLERLQEMRDFSPTSFESLYQQEPTPASGNILKGHWFKDFYLSDLPPNFRVKAVVDSAYTEKEANDPTEMWVYTYIMGIWYVLEVVTFRKGWNDAVKMIPDVLARWDKTLRALIRIEPKANGISLVQKLRMPELHPDTKKVLRPALNVIQSKAPTNDKVARTMTNIEYFEAEKVRFLAGAAWQEKVKLELTQFPKGKHDESVDCANMMIGAEVSGGYTVGGG